MSFGPECYSATKSHISLVAEQELGRRIAAGRLCISEMGH